MPDYKYKCTQCDYVEVFTLQMSSDPKAKLDCGDCGEEESMTRRIGVAQFPEKVGKVWAGEWFKKTYGHDMTEGTARKAREKAEMDRERRALEKDGVKFKFRSKQVGGKDRIIIPDKDD